MEKLFFKQINKDIEQLDKNININQSNNDFDNVIIMNVFKK